MQLNAVRTLTVRGQSQGLDKVKADLDAVSASQQGVAQSSTAMASATETSARRQLSAANAFERLMERNDRMIYLQRQLEREMVVVNRAHEQGAIDATRHAQAVDLLQAKYERLAAAEAQARTQIVGTTAAIDGQTAAARRLGAANDNSRGFNTGNVAAQFQDIAVTAAMGQSPLTIALQQGTQLSAVLGGQGLTGVVKTLGAAFASIISPVSLITIGVVGLAAAGIQAFTSMTQDAEKSTDALEKHKEWLDKILAGYEGAATAADRAARSATKLPQGVVEGTIQQSMTESSAEIARRIDDIVKKQAELNRLSADWATMQKEAQALFPDDAEKSSRFQGLIDDVATLNQLKISATSTKPELDAVMATASRLMQTASEPAIKNLATEVYNLSMSLRAAQGELAASAAALGALQLQAAKGFDIGNTLSQITSLTPELRSPKEQVADLFEKGAAAARTTGQLQNLADAAKKAYEAIDQQDAQRAAEKAATTSTNALNQQAEAYKNLTASIEDRIAKAEFEVSILGMTEDAAAKLRVEFDLMQQAKSAGIGLDPDVLARAVDKISEAEKKVRDTNKALADQKRVMDQLAGSAQTVVGSLMGATGMSDTPFGGAVNGALGSLMKGDWIGALIGGVTGLFTGFIEQEKKHQEAIKAANDNRPSIEAFIDTGYGREIDETTAAVQRFKQQAEAYIKLAEAAGDKALVRRLQDAAEAYRDTLRAQERVDRLTDKVDADRDRLRDAYERESSALRDVIQQQTAYVDGLKDLKRSLLLDSNLSPLSPSDRLLEAQRQFQQTSTAALGGDASAQARLQDAATSYLEQARNFYASSEGYVSIFDQVQSVLDRAISAGTNQISDAQQQLAVLDSQVSKLIEVNTSVLSVAEAVRKLESTLAKLALAQIEEAKETTKAVKQGNRETSQQGGRRAA